MKKYNSFYKFSSLPYLIIVIATNALRSSKLLYYLSFEHSGKEGWTDSSW